MSILYSNFLKNVKKIFSELCNLKSSTKKAIKYGTIICMCLVVLGAVLIYFNHSGLNYDSYFEFIATSIVRSGFTILAIVIIGSMLIDYVFSHR